MQISEHRNFGLGELCCPCCGELPDDYLFHAKTLQRAREIARAPFNLNSAHRCFIHNWRVGGAPRSMHRVMAFDISVVGQNRHLILRACKAAGFTGFGYYERFLHVDLGRPRFWYSSKRARLLWSG